MFSVRFTLIVLISMLFTFFIRIFVAQPYPAILLPQGGYTITKINDKIQVDCKYIYGRDAAGIVKEIDKASLISPIPEHFILPLIECDFGLNDSLFMKSKRVKLLKKFGVFPYTKYELLQRKQSAVTWLKGRLKILKLDTSEIKVITNTFTISTITGKIISTSIKDEKTYNLN